MIDLISISKELFAQQIIDQISKCFPDSDSNGSNSIANKSYFDGID